jgi:hypothetical protein
MNNLNRKKINHGLKKTGFWRSWQNLKQRCSNPRSKSYHRYGGRGISFNPEWNDFLNFKNDMYVPYLKHIKKHGEKNTTIDRIDVNGNYNKENCRWATQQIQQTNRVNSLNITIGKQTKNINGWSKFLGIPRNTVYARIIRTKHKFTAKFVIQDYMNNPEAYRQRQLLYCKNYKNLTCGKTDLL